MAERAVRVQPHLLTDQEKYAPVTAHTLRGRVAALVALVGDRATALQHLRQQPGFLLVRDHQLQASYSRLVTALGQPHAAEAVRSRCDVWKRGEGVSVDSS